MFVCVVRTVYVACVCVREREKNGAGLCDDRWLQIRSTLHRSHYETFLSDCLFFNVRFERMAQFKLRTFTSR